MKEYLEQLAEYAQKRPSASLSMEEKGYSSSEEANQFLKGNLFGFLCGLIFDQNIKSDLAWRAPFELSKRIDGEFSPTTIASYDIENLQKIIAEKPALHRYPAIMARNLNHTSNLLLQNYNGNAAELFSKIDKPEILKARLLQLKGVGDKKANLGAFMYMKDFSTESEPFNSTGMAYDIHLNRVLSRSGQFLNQSQASIDQNFREHFGESFASMGNYLWLIGREYCHNTAPDCMFCPLTNSCLKIL